MALKVTYKQGLAATSTVHKHKGATASEVTDTEKVGEVLAFKETPCVVGVEASLTINLGNFNSTKVGCTLQLPCLHSEIDEVFEFAKNWVNEKMESMADEANASQSD